MSLVLYNLLKTPLTIKLRPSKRLNFYFLFIHCVAVVSAMLSSLDLISLVVLQVCIIFSLVYWTFFYDVNTREFVWHNDDMWSLKVLNKKGALQEDKYVLHTINHLSFVYIHFYLKYKERQKLLSVYIFPDQLDASIYHALFVRLKFYQEDTLCKAGSEN